jgi:CheY-like chemotaxis protein
MHESTARSRFLSELRQVLRNLYDPTELHHSPLIQLFGTERHGNPILALRRIVTDGIQALKPDEDVPPAAPAWRIYQVLAYCYVEQSSQTVVANNLGLSVRQLRRQQREAEKALADYLWAYHHLETTAEHLLADSVARASIPLAPTTGTDGRREELAWLKQSLASETVNVAEVLQAAVKLATPLSHRTNVQLEYDAPQTCAPIVGQASLLRQALLSLLTGAISSVPGGTVRVTAVAQARGLGVRVEATAAEATALSDRNEWAESLAMARQLIGLFGGELATPLAPDSRSTRQATLVLPPAERVPVLVIDDNADTLRLFERYLTETRYLFIGAREPEQALALAEQLCPRIVVLDVMLPNLDGWEVLGRLREHPRTGHIPIVVCTILPQQSLAQAMGAAAFIRKPVSREVLLAVLDQQIASSAPESPSSPQSRQ